MAYLQATLLADDLPADAQVVALHLEDAISELFRATVELATDDPDLDLEGLLGKPVAVRIEGAFEGIPLVVHGQIEVAEYVDARREHHHYRLVLAPLVQALAHRVRSRIFQDKSAVEIVRTVLKEGGIPAEAVAWHTTDDDYPKREFCVQYKESELEFIMRLLEEEGIFFCFEHSDTAHVMHFSDDNEQQPALPGDPVLPATAELHAERESVTGLVYRLCVVPDLFLARDWDFHRPDRPAESTAEIAAKPEIEQYEYPGYFQTPTDGSRVASVRAQQAALPARLLRGESNSVRLVAGRKLTILDAPVSSFDGDYFVAEATHVFRAPFYAADDDPAHYGVSFAALPEAVPLRPRRRARKPCIHGIESAVVTGPPGEEIHVDEFGRIKVHFFWDREGKIDDKASCWIRVQQQNTSGSMILPRVGWEVSVGFLDGDPDRPVVLQKLYNRETMPPYMLPDHKTQGSLQSATSPGGGATNEIRLQDGDGGMEFFIHSARDLALAAGNDAIEEIKVDAHEEIGLVLNTKVGADETVNVGAAQSVNVTGDALDQTVGSKKVNVGALDDWGITSDFSINTGGNRSETIGAMMNVLANKVQETYHGNYTRTVGAVLAINTASTLAEVVGGSKTETVGGAKMELIARARAEDVGASKTLTSGLIDEKTGTDLALSTKAALTINVGGPIVEKCGEAFTIGAKGVVITAGSAELKVGGTTLTAKGGKLSVKTSSLGAAGGPQLKLKGKINYKG